ncbi:MAG: two-component system, OmpR family, operon response regulator KdpE [Acidobacteriota bacterium]|jgi:two-component system KDP operon response regulator KdpE|nr:two-component system, OmpR family, operon response regulator KdpE [Acidobacteriota bacterium]
MTRPNPLILVIDDDADIRRNLSRELALAGYDTLAAADGVEGRELFEYHRPDLVITDVAMPRADGLAVISAVRRTDRTPVLVLSVRGEEEDRVRALDLGADDYVTKPFYLRELLARVRTQLRRASMTVPEVLRFPDLTIDRGRRTVVQGEREVKLTPTELAVLELLASHAGRPVTLRQIIATVWTGAPATTVDTVRVHVGSLRRKLEPDPANPRYIGTEPWVGYRFLAEPVDG